MAPSQKMAWGNVIVWGSYVVAVTILLAVNGTVFFWQDDSLRNAFYTITGAAIAAFITMMLVVWVRTSKSGVTLDERDNKIMNGVNAISGPISMAAVAFTSLILMIIYLEDRSSVMSPYFLVYITMINVTIYWLAQAINTLVAYRRS